MQLYNFSKTQDLYTRIHDCSPYRILSRCVTFLINYIISMNGYRMPQKLFHINKRQILKIILVKKTIEIIIFVYIFFRVFKK